ncbi:AAA family ATPase [Tenacibaculum xiamenense]|uniref:AAA family ATPase n=1 Tax=Tenacibaculum xiamenense TaxID=1261553 RepID=UPI003894254F
MMQINANTPVLTKPISAYMDENQYRKKVKNFYLEGNKGYIQTDNEPASQDDIRKAFNRIIGRELSLSAKNHLTYYFELKNYKDLNQAIIHKFRSRFQRITKFLDGTNDGLSIDSVKALAILIKYNTFVSKKERLQRQIPKDFVGRNFVFNRINNFINNHTQGYYYLIGNPGLGKTSLALKYAYDNDAIIHRINYQNNGSNTASYFIHELCNQLNDRYNLHVDDFIASNHFDGDMLIELLMLITETIKRKIVIVVDGIDELKNLEYFRRSNILYLPSQLPEGIFFLLTMRDIENQIRLPNKENDFYIDHLSHDSTENMQDIRQYLRNASQKKEIINYLQHHSISEEDFINILEEKSEGNFMYLNHVIREIIGGGYQQKEISEFPKGLQNYYRDHWERMMEGVSEIEKEIKLKTIYVLAAYEHPIDKEYLTNCVKSEIETLKSFQIAEVINNWKQFLNTMIDDENTTKYYIYHKSFLDFLHNQELVKAVEFDIETAKKVIVKHMEGKAFDDFDKDETGDIIVDWEFED